MSHIVWMAERKVVKQTENAKISTKAAQVTKTIHSHKSHTTQKNNEMRRRAPASDRPRSINFVR